MSELRMSIFEYRIIKICFGFKSWIGPRRRSP